MVNNGLPPGWEMSTDPSTGRPFYINHNTMQTSWTPPVETPLPSGWEQQRDGEGRIFFVNTLTGMSQWEDPRLSDSGGDTSQGGNVSYPSFGDAHNEPSISDPNKWSCSSCTFENDIGSDSCAMCGASRPGASSQSNPPNDRSTTSSFSFQDDSIDPETAAAIAAAQSMDYENGEVEEKITDPRDLAPYMVPDEHSEVCTLCAKPFDWKNRRHHCKCCGDLLCGECSSRKAKFSIPGMKEVDRRVCDLCFDHQNAGDRHCYLRYIGILRDAGSSREDDRMLALRGIGDMIEKLPDALQETAGIDQQASAMRTLDVVQRSGGAATLFELMDPNQSTDIQIQSCRVTASVAAVAASSSRDNLTAFSKSMVCGQLSHGTTAMRAIKAILSRPSAPWEAQMYIAQTMYLLGDEHSIQEASRTMHVLPALCEALLATQESLQELATKAVEKLVANNPRNIDEMLDANGMQALILLLSSPNIEIQKCAANAICHGLELGDTSNQNSENAILASRVRDSLVQLGGASTVVSMLRSGSPTIARSGLTLVRYLSNGQAEVVRASGAVPLVVALLASRDQTCQSSAAQILRNVAVCSQAGSRDVLESGGLAMTISLLGSYDAKTKANAAALCEAFASEEKGASIILESGAVPALVGLVRSPDNDVRGPAAGALVQLLQAGQHTKQAVVNAGGVEALLALENSTDPFVIRQLVGAVYSFVSDEALLQSLTRRIAPPTMAMKLLQLLNNRSATIIDSATIEMLLLVVAVLCGARDGDQFDEELGDMSALSPEEKMQRSQEQQTRELVASNGAPLVIPLLMNAHSQPALVLAAFRLLLSVCKSPNGAQGIAKAGGIPAAVRALDDSLQVEGHSGESHQLVFHLRLYGLTLFGKLCGGTSGSNTLSVATVDDIRFGVRAISKVLEHPLNASSPEDTLAIQLAAVRALRNLSRHSGNWEIIASTGLPQLIEILLASDSQPALLRDIALIISNLAKLEKHSDTVLDAGAVFALLGLLSEKESEAVEAGLSTLNVLAESSKRCRLAIVDQGGAPKLLHIAEQRPQPLPVGALRCLVTLTQEPANGPKITSEPGATDLLLRLMKSADPTTADLALKVLLAVAKDSENIWEQLVVNADIDSSIALLRLGPPRVQAHAISTIAALCGDSPGYALCASPTILEILPLLVSLLSPPEHLGADKSESPAKEAAAACALLSSAQATRQGLLDAEVIPALVNLLLRERRLGRPRSATSEHTLHALFSFSEKDTTGVDESDSLPTIGIWDRINHLNKRRDTLDSVIMILDAHIRDTAPTPSGCGRLELCEDAIILLGKVPLTLSPNEITLLGRSARSINLLMNESAPENIMTASLKTLQRIAKEETLAPVLIAAGTIRSISLLLEPLLNTDSTTSQPLEPNVILHAAALIASLVKGAQDRSVDDAVIGTKAIPALAALITRTNELFHAEQHQTKALSAGLEAISSLSQGGVVIQKAIMASCDDVLPALAQVAARFDEHVDGEAEPHVGLRRASHAMLTLSRLATLDEQRVLIVSPDHGIPQVCTRILESADPEQAKSSPEIIELVKATAQLIADLGPTVANTCPEIAHPLIEKVLQEPTFSSSWLATLQALENLTLCPSTAKSIATNHQIVSILKNIMGKTASASKEHPITTAHLQAASSVLVAVASVPIGDSANTATEEDFIEACSLVLLGKDATVADFSVTINNSLLILRQLQLYDSARSKMRSNASLLRAIKQIGVSAESEVFTSYLASKIVSSLGTGDRILKQPKPKAAAHVPPPTPAAAPHALQSAPQNPPQKLTSSPPPPPNHGHSMPSTSPLLAPQVAPPPPPMKQPMNKGSLLPTYSGSYSGGLRTNPSRSSSFSSSPSDERASLELAMKLQAEEQQRASSSSSKNSSTPRSTVSYPPPLSSYNGPINPSSTPSSTVWNCGVCTLENPMSATKCAACDTPKSGKR